MPDAAVTRMVEDYAALIWKAYEWPGGEASTTDLAASLGVTPSTVSANLKKLARDGFISYAPYGSITLTEQGRRIAVGVVRRHRIIESYLVQRLGLRWDQVHAEAERMEHAVSELVLSRMEEALGYPSHDPHGDPIPDADGNIVVAPSRSLPEADEGAELQVVRVSDRSPELLRYLQENGVVVGARVRVGAIMPAAAVLPVEVGGVVVPLSLTAAEAVRVA